MEIKLAAKKLDGVLPAELQEGLVAILGRLDKAKDTRVIVSILMESYVAMKHKQGGVELVKNLADDIIKAYTSRHLRRRSVMNITLFLMGVVLGAIFL